MNKILKAFENNKLTPVFITGIFYLTIDRVIMPILFKNGSICLCKGVTGIPCPGCGMTRASTELLHGDFRGAWEMHPLIFYIIIAIPLGLFFKFVTKNQKHFNILTIITIIIFLVTWLVRMILLFPNYAPLDYNDQNLLSLIIRLLF